VKGVVGWLACLAVVGCGHAPVPQVARVTPPARPMPADTSQPFQVPAIGLSGRAPAAAQVFELDTQASDGPMHVVGVSCEADGLVYTVARYFRGGRDRAADEQLLANSHKLLKSISRELRVDLGEMPGIELEGVATSGAPTILRSYVVGDGFWLAQVVRPPGQSAAVDSAKAQKFFAALSLVQPWSTHAFPEAHFSALLPDGGVRLARHGLHVDDADFAEAVWVGGASSRIFMVWGWALQGSATADERLDISTARLEQDGNRVVWQSPLVVDGARARDLLVQDARNWTRFRLIVTDSQLYILQATAKTKAAVLDDSVTRFLESFRRY
jgi:hypothetical protein